MVNFKIDIISDAVCPWCYIGQRRLLRAITLFSKTHPLGSSASFAIHWHPFYLDPTAPAQGIPLRQRMAQKFGGLERVDAMQQRLVGIGAREGIVFDFDARIGRTRDVHRLIQVAGASASASGADVVDVVDGADGVNGDIERPSQPEQTLQNTLVTSIFEGYFEQGHDITDITWLESVGRASGIPQSLLHKWRHDDAGGAVVDREAERNQRFTSGVPQFTINGRYVVEGAQETEEFLMLFGEIVEGAGRGEGGNSAAAVAESC